MKKALYILTTALLASVSSAVLAGERIGDFALIDNQGSQHHMAWYDDQNAVVILPQAIGATDTSALSAIQGLRETYAEQGVVFFLMNLVRGFFQTLTWCRKLRLILLDEYFK